MFFDQFQCSKATFEDLLDAWFLKSELIGLLDNTNVCVYI